MITIKTTLRNRIKKIDPSKIVRIKLNANGGLVGCGPDDIIPYSSLSSSDDDHEPNGESDTDPIESEGGYVPFEDEYEYPYGGTKNGNLFYQSSRKRHAHEEENQDQDVETDEEENQDQEVESDGEENQVDDEEATNKETFDADHKIEVHDESEHYHEHYHVHEHHHYHQTISDNDHENEDSLDDNDRYGDEESSDDPYGDEYEIEMTEEFSEDIETDGEESDR